NFHLSPFDNELQKVFWGRVPIHLAVAFLKFQERSRVQRLLHQLKYRGQEEVGELLGRWLGSQLKVEEPFLAIEVVVPIPLHKRKLQQRGYNQVAGFSKEIAQALDVPVAENALLKKKSVSTQTKKNRQARWEAMRELYAVKDASAVRGKHVLLIDDVITTGATLEACAQVLLKSGASTVSIAAIAYTL
ncbi:MAG: ComF family protein, partial [Rufibacter sp.]